MGVYKEVNTDKGIDNKFRKTKAHPGTSFFFIYAGRSSVVLPLSMAIPVKMPRSTHHCCSAGSHGTWTDTCELIAIPLSRLSGLSGG